jgi:serine/threonine-protein kinase
MSDRFDYRLAKLMGDALSGDSKPQEEDLPLLNELKRVSWRYGSSTPLAKGGMKNISRVHDLKTDRDVAMATLHGRPKSHAFEDFLREAFLTAKLEHPNIITIHDIGLGKDDKPFFTMELKVGQHLGEVIQHLEPSGSETGPRTDLLQIFTKVCDAMDYAHSKGVLHLDLKPSNIQVGAHGEVVVCDWGLGKINDQGDAAEDADLRLDADLLNDLSRDGKVKGTPGYMAPEQVAGEGKLDQKTDVYALGCILYTILTGAPPFDGELEDILHKTTHGQVADPKERFPNLAIPSGLSAIAMKATAKSPEDRYGSVDQLRHDLQRVLNGHASQAENAGPLKLIKLLVLRNLKLSIIIFTSILLMIALSILFIIELSKKEQKARIAQKEAETMLEKYLESNARLETMSDDLLHVNLKRSIVLIHNDQFTPALELLRTTRLKYPASQSLSMELANLELCMTQMLAASHSYEKINYGGSLYDLSKSCADMSFSGDRISEDYLQLFRGLVDYPILQKRALDFHKSMASEIKDHAKVAHSYLMAINPQWEGKPFTFNKRARHLSLGGAGLQSLGQKGFGSALDGLGLQALSLKDTDTIDLDLISHLSLLSLDVSQTTIKKWRDIKKLLVLGKLIVSQHQHREFEELNIPDHLQVIVKDPSGLEP